MGWGGEKLLQCIKGTDNIPGHELVQLLLVLLVLSSDGMLGLLLHPLHKVLHVLEGIDLEGDKQVSQCEVSPSVHCISLGFFADMIISCTAFLYDIFPPDIYLQAWLCRPAALKSKLCV